MWELWISDPPSAAANAIRPSAWPSLWTDATYVKVRQNGRVVSVAVTLAVGVNSRGRDLGVIFHRFSAIGTVRSNAFDGG